MGHATKSRPHKDPPHLRERSPQTLGLKNAVKGDEKKDNVTRSPSSSPYGTAQ